MGNDEAKGETENDQGCLFSFKSSTHSAGELHEKEAKVKITVHSLKLIANAPENRPKPKRKVC